MLTAIQQTWVYDDGGRARAGYQFLNGNDCVVRAIAIATEMPYELVVDIVDKACRGDRGDSQSGVYDTTYDAILVSLGWKKIRTNAHLNSDEFPPGRLILRVSGHLLAMIEGVVHDIGDPSEHGSRRVYAYWRLAG